MQAIIPIPLKPLRASVLFFLRVSPKAIASAFKSFHSLLTLNTEYGGQGRIVPIIIPIPQQPLRASVLFFLRVSPKAQASAFKSFHSCFRSTRSTEDKGELCQQSFQQPPAISPCLLTFFFSVFRRRPKRQRLNRFTRLHHARRHALFVSFERALGQIGARFCSKHKKLAVFSKMCLLKCLQINIGHFAPLSQKYAFTPRFAPICPKILHQI